MTILLVHSPPIGLEELKSQIAMILECSNVHVRYSSNVEGGAYVQFIFGGSAYSMEFADSHITSEGQATLFEISRNHAGHSLSAIDDLRQLASKLRDLGLEVDVPK